MNSVQMLFEVPAPRPDSQAPAPAGAFATLGRFAVRRRRWVLALFVLGVLAAGILGFRAFAELKAAGYDDPGSESARAQTAVVEKFGAEQPVLALAVEVPAGVDDPVGAAAAVALVGRLAAEEGVSSVISYWTSGRTQQLRGSDGRTGQVLVYAAAADEGQATELGRRVTEAYGTGPGDPAGLRVFVGGPGAVDHAITENITADLTRAESIAMPITLVLLVLVFGGLVAAGLPLVVAAGAIVGSFLVLWLVTQVTDVSVFSLNLITGLGLGLGVDYALLVVNRFREELAAGRDVEDAVIRTVATAGRTVAVSGATVAVVLGAMLFYPLYFLRSFGYAGIAVTLLAVLSTIIALPAILALLGRRVNRLQVRRGDLAPRDVGAWSRLATFVMRRPWPVLLATVGALGALATPSLGVVFGQVDARALPEHDPAARASAVLAERFPGREASPIEIVLPGTAAEPDRVRRYAEALSVLPGVSRVTAPDVVVVDGAAVAPNPQPQHFTAGEDVRLSLISDVSPITAEGREQIERIRAVPAPVADRAVGGAAASFSDAQAAMGDRTRWALAWVGLATLVVLFLYTGSLLLPFKAIALNVLSLGATLGALVWVFQEGHLGWLVGDFTLVGTIDTATAVLIAITAFALSMDYEVFLLSRIKEEHDAGQDTVVAVSLGLQRSGRIITAAAVLLAVVFAAFVSSGVTPIKQLGLGVAFAIVLDATVVRGLLVPAIMRLAGRWNWWAPPALARLHRRFGLSD